ncbi:MAG: transcription elongation factor GreA [Deltaproteobacteria bacterium]|nr:transcription elongation factor GreA [Deltaproteobacteria bacterium]
MYKLPVIEKLEEELRKVERELRVDVPRQLKVAAAHGDLSENSEYDAAKERQTFLQARVSQLHGRIESLSSINLDALPRDRVGFGSRVTVEDVNTGDIVTYEMVAPDEVDPNNGKISLSSPIGKALLNRELDDEVRIQLPTGLREYVVTELVTLHQSIAIKGEPES